MIKIILHFWKLNFFSIIEYKISFILQTIGMMVSDLITIIIWIFFFNKFGTIGGMNFDDYIMLYCCVLFIFSFTHILFGGYKTIGDLVINGKLDPYLLLPKNLLFKILISSFVVSAYGDLFFGIFLLFFVKNMTILLLFKFFIIAIFGSIVLSGFLICFQSLAFFIGSSRELSQAMFELMLGPPHYPFKVFEGTILKLIFITVIPVYYGFFLPYELFQNFNLFKFIILILSSIVFFTLGNIVFYKGLKRYESGNLMNTNV